MTKSKTVWTAVGTLVFGVVGWLTGQLEPQAAMTLIALSVQNLFQRLGTKKVEDKVNKLEVK